MEFVTRKITNAVARIALGKQKVLELGNMEAKRDWGYAPDYMEAAQLMMEADRPDDYVVGTGTTHTVRELCEVAFGKYYLDYKDYVRINPEFFRPTEVEILVADTSKIKEELGWEHTTSFESMISKMTEADWEFENTRQG
jgi:GDPmannose 4,6-dehydratase